VHRPPRLNNSAALLTACRNPQTTRAPQGKYKPLKLSCVHRAMLLTDLYQAMAAAAGLAKCSVALRILG
jgi:hypothetical protein